MEKTTPDAKQLNPDQLLLKRQLDNFGSHSLLMGILLALVGSIGVLVPALMSFATVGFVAGLLFVGGAFWGYHAFKSKPGSFMAWLKPLLLILFGVLLVVYPLPGVASLALMISIYLFIDAYGSFALAHARHPGKGWGWMAFNGVADLALAVLFLVGWPQSSLLFVGIFVGISLIFDGWALIVIGWAKRKTGSGDKRSEGTSHAH